MLIIEILDVEDQLGVRIVVGPQPRNREKPAGAGYDLEFLVGPGREATSDNRVLLSFRLNGVDQLPDIGVVGCGMPCGPSRPLP